MRQLMLIVAGLSLIAILISANAQSEDSKPREAIVPNLSSVTQRATPINQIVMEDLNGPDLKGKDGPYRKLGYDLAFLNRLNQAKKRTPPAVSAERLPLGVQLMPAKGNGEMVLVDAIAEDSGEQLLLDLKRLGLQHGSSYGRVASGWLPVDSLPAVATLPSLRFIRPNRPKLKTGSVNSQGDFVVRANQIRPPTNPTGPTGSGIKVGVLSGSFNCLGGSAADVGAGEIPSGIVVVQEEPNCSGPLGNDEGRAMMQIVADIAPGASQLFATADGGEAAFANNIIALANAGAKVIVDDVGYPTEPMFQDGIISQAVNSVVASGVSYFSAAGNSGRFSYQSSFRNSGTIVSGLTLHDFDPSAGTSTVQPITILSGAALDLDFQWDQPFASAGGAGSASDVEIFLLDPTGNTIVALSIDDNIANGDPYEGFTYINTGPTGQFLLVIGLAAGPAPGLMKYIISDDGGESIDAFSTQSSTSVGHSNSAGAVGVGAAPYYATPACGTSPPAIEDFSSAGGTPILFDTAGNRLASPIVRQKPEIVAPDDANTTFFGGHDIPTLPLSSACNDSDSFPNFLGTSAAAPNAAGVAALMLQVNPILTPAQIRSALENTAIDMATSGFDFDSGFGLIQADAAVAAITPTDTTPDTFTFTAQNNVPVSAAIVSNTVVIAGINQPASVTILGGAYSIGCNGTFSSANTTITNGQSICLRHTSAAAPSSAVSTTLTVGGVSGTFTSTTAGSVADTTPNTFSFTAQNNVPTSTTVISNAATITGINAASPISVTGGEYGIGCANFTSAAGGTITSGQTVCVRHTSASIPGTAVSTTLTIGGVSGIFTSTTAATTADTTPDAFSFISASNVAKDTTQTSNTITISGINAASPISISGGKYSIGCDSSTFTSKSGTIVSGQQVCVRHKSADKAGKSVVTTLTVGGVSVDFTSTTQVASGGGGNDGGGYDTDQCTFQNGCVRTSGGGSTDFIEIVLLLMAVVFSKRRSLT